jgi:hypothetical protein
MQSSGLQKLFVALNNLSPDIVSIGIVTAENPKSKQAPQKENKTRNVWLERDLNDLKYKFHQLKNSCVNMEKPFVVLNVRRDDIVKLGTKYNQDSVIYIQRQTDCCLVELIQTCDGNYRVRNTLTVPVS